MLELLNDQNNVPVLQIVKVRFGREVRYTVSEDASTARKSGANADTGAGGSQRGLEHCAESHDGL